MPEHDGLPVHGYKPQTDQNVDLVNKNKVLEEEVLRQLDTLSHGSVDKRWLATGRTLIEQGFMAVNRSIFQPRRIALARDEAPNGDEIPS